MNEILSHEMKIRIWYKETDQMGFVHHSNYIKYYEEARSAFMRHLGVSYADMEHSGVLMPILHVESDYKLIRCTIYANRVLPCRRQLFVLLLGMGY